MNTAEYKYTQETNYCEAQYANSLIFTFRSIEEFMGRLNDAHQKGAIILLIAARIFKLLRKLV